MRICIVAEHASYQFGGEAVLPLHYFSRLRARGIEAWLVVHSRTRSELESRFPEEIDRIRFVEDAWFHKLLCHLSRFLPRRVSEATLGLLSQLITQSIARSIVRELIQEGRVDIVHQPIPVSPRFPSLMFNLGVPVVIGPLNGGMEYPLAFRNRESKFTRLNVAFGKRLSGIVNTFLPGKKRASFVLVANKRTQLVLPPDVRGQVVVMPENGVDLTIWSLHSPEPGSIPSTTQPSRFVFIGRLIDLKCVDIAIEALSQCSSGELEVIGDGPMRSRWERLADQLGVASRVSFLGWLPQKTCALRLQSAAALVLPSICESGGAVVLEAMAAGLPVIATKWGGPPDYIDDTCGFLVEPHSRQALVEGFASAMRQILEVPELGRSLGANGSKRVRQDFDWDKKVNRMMEIYRRAISASHADQTKLLSQTDPQKT